MRAHVRTHMHARTRRRKWSGAKREITFSVYCQHIPLQTVNDTYIIPSASTSCFAASSIKATTPLYAAFNTALSTELKAGSSAQSSIIYLLYFSLFHFLSSNWKSLFVCSVCMSLNTVRSCKFFRTGHTIYNYSIPLPAETANILKESCWRSSP